MSRILRSIIPAFALNKYRSLKAARAKSTLERMYRGDDVLCPICRSSFSAFGDFGPKKRPNARCHSCGSLERHRLLFLYLTEKFKMFEQAKKPLRLLHFAPERAFYQQFSQNAHISYTPCDLYPEAYRYAGAVQISKVDITQIPFDDGSFDFILCNHVLEHIPDDRLAMSELYRVLAKQGNGIFQVHLNHHSETYEDLSITTPEERIKAFGQHDHVRIYGYDYQKRLESAGFIVRAVPYGSTFSSEDRLKYGINRSEIIYHCEK
jgi:SAM-dependent methyltransferase